MREFRHPLGIASRQSLVSVLMTWAVGEPPEQTSRQRSDNHKFPAREITHQLFSKHSRKDFSWWASTDWDYSAERTTARIVGPISRCLGPEDIACLALTWLWNYFYSGPNNPNRGPRIAPNTNHPRVPNGTTISEYCGSIQASNTI